MSERIKLLLIVISFLGFYYIPFSSMSVRGAGLEAFLMIQEYAREHVLACLLPAFFIAGAIPVFISQTAVLKYFRTEAKKVLSYSMASDRFPGGICPWSGATMKLREWSNLNLME